MTAGTEDPINVVVAMDFSDDIMEKIRAVSPRLRVERYFPEVPEKAWADVEVLYTQRQFPDPAQAPLLRWIQMHSAGIDHVLKQPITASKEQIGQLAIVLHGNARPVQPLNGRPLILPSS